MITVAFDIDDTIWKCVWRPRLAQVPDYDIIQIVKWFHRNGDQVYFWSAAGIDYTQTIIDKLGLTDCGEVIRKGSMKVDLAFDDEQTKLGKVDVQVSRALEVTEEVHLVNIKQTENLKVKKGEHLKLLIGEIKGDFVVLKVDEQNEIISVMLEKKV